MLTPTGQWRKQIGKSREFLISLSEKKKKKKPRDTYLTRPTLRANVNSKLINDARNISIRLEISSNSIGRTISRSRIYQADSLERSFSFFRKFSLLYA